MKILTLVLVNAFFGWFFYKLTRKKDILSHFKAGKWWLTWLAVGVITLMDELTSIFYAPSEASNIIDIKAIFYIAAASVLMRFLSNRMVEISHILHEYKMYGGGVYNFSYLVIGPVASFIAVASIMVTYVLTASISAVSAVNNGLAFLELSGPTKYILSIVAVWAVAFLNILGIKENAKVTFGIFIFTTLVFMNFLVSGFFEMTGENYGVIWDSARQSLDQVRSAGSFKGYGLIVLNLSAVILAYSGIESVLQTASLVDNWRQIKRAYTFLALTVGIVTPVVAALVLSHRSPEFLSHHLDLIPFYAGKLNGEWFGVAMSLVAAITLIMAINTAYVASAELIERLALRYNFHWVVKTNRWDSLYVIHIANAIFYTTIIMLVGGMVGRLAEMYALGLVASFVINMGALLIYRYQKGKKEAREYTTSRLGTFIIFALLLSCFVYLASTHLHGMMLWAVATGISLLIGILVARKRSPEIVQAARGDSSMDLIMYLANNDQKNVHLHFKRPFDQANLKLYGLSVYVTFYSARQDIPPKLADNHFRLPVKHANLYENILAVLNLLNFELPEHNVTAHFGWPTSSWLDRLSVGVMTFQLMKLPLVFPSMNFKIEQYSKINKDGE